ncbi:MAG: SdpI family protein [Clostridium perfringens]|nr:SdpI family protein [Clostridium perfringens]
MVIVFMGLIIFASGVICKYFHDDYRYHPGLAIGYRTKYAMKDKDTWLEANNYFFKFSIISLIFSLLFTILTNFLDSKIINIIYIPIILLIICGPILLTEIHLRKFNKKNS